MISNVKVLSLFVVDFCLVLVLFFFDIIHAPHKSSAPE